VTIPEAVKLLGINRKEVEATFDQSLDNRASRHFDGHRDPLWVPPRHGPQPVRQPSQTGSIMIHDPFTHPATVAVEHTDLMLLGAPINAHKPIVWQGLILSF
jgi:hypothetical protein